MAGVVVEKLPGFQDEVPRVCYLVIDPRLHGQGFGSMLMRQCEDWAAARGHRAIWLFVLRHKERLCQWYSKMGYQTVDEHRTATVPVSGQGKMEGTVQMLGREVTLKRKPLWVNLFVHFMRIWWRSFWDSEIIQIRSFNVWSTTEGIVSTILDSLSCRGFWLAVKLYRHTGTLSLFDPSLCGCMDSLCSDHWRAVVIVGCLVLARLPILHCLVVLTSRRTKGVVCCVLSSEHANMKYRNIDLLGKVVPRLSNWNRRKVCRKAVSPFVTVEVRLCKRKSNDFLGSWRVRDTSK